MNKEFVPYEQALALKELGFDEPCLGYYVTVEVPNPFLVTTKITDTQGGYFTFAPTYSQAFRWFREKYNKLYSVNIDLSDNLKDKIYVDTIEDHLGSIVDRSEEYKTDEEAELACLRKLIEIIESKSE